MKSVVRTAPHEYEAHYFYRGLGLWLAADRITSDHGGSLRGSFKTNGEKWDVTLSYQPSGLAPPDGGVTPGGTEIQHDTIREYRLNLVRDDEVREKKAKCHIAPRWKGLQSDSGKDAAKAAWDAGDGSNVRINAANIEFDRIRDLLGRAAAAVNINSQHVAESNRLEQYSTVTDAARYVRIDKRDSGPIHGREGPLARMGHLLESDRTGYRKVVQDDSKRSGYYHTATLGPMRVRNAWPDHTFPREIKHYYVEHPSAYPDNHALSNPKLEVSYQRKRWDESLSVEDHEQISEEINQSIYSILEASELPLSPEEGDIFVSDAYFEADTTTTPRIPPLSLERVKSDQRNVVVRQLADGLSPVEFGSLKTLVADGGEVSPKDIAEEQGFHPDSVRKALRRISDMVERDHGSVSLRSHYVAEQVADAIDEARESVSEAVNAASHALESAKSQNVDERTDELIAFCQSHGITISEREKRITVKMGRLASSEKWSEILVHLKDRWNAAGRDTERLKEATTEYFDTSTDTPNVRPAIAAFGPRR